MKKIVLLICLCLILFSCSFREYQGTVTDAEFFGTKRGSSSIWRLTLDYDVVVDVKAIRSDPIEIGKEYDIFWISFWEERKARRVKKGN